MDSNNLVAYSATSISVIGRLIFMYLLYSKKSTNLYSLTFSLINQVSSCLWIIYSKMILDTPLLVRGSQIYYYFQYHHHILFIIDYVILTIRTLK